MPIFKNDIDEVIVIGQREVHASFGFDVILHTLGKILVNRPIIRRFNKKPADQISKIAF